MFLLLCVSARVVQLRIGLFVACQKFIYYKNGWGKRERHLVRDLFSLLMHVSCNYGYGNINRRRFLFSLCMWAGGSGARGLGGGQKSRR